MPRRGRDDVLVRFGGDDSRFRRAVKSVRGQITSLAGHFGKVGQTIGGFFTNTLPAGIAGAGAALLALSKDAFNFGDEIAKTADKVGVSTTALQELRFAADSAGVSAGNLETGLQRFSRRLGEAQRGEGVLLKTLKELNIELRDQEGWRSLEEVLYDYADAIANADGEQRQLLLAFQAFDSEGAGLVNMLRQGGAAMREQTNRAHELALVLDEEAVRASERFTQRWNEISQSWNTWWRGTLIQMWQGLERLSGANKSLEEQQERLATNEAELAKAREKAAESSGLWKWIAEQNIKALEDENQMIREQIGTLDALHKRRERNRNQPLAPVGLPAGATRKTSSASSDKDFRVKSPEQIGAALDAFRRGEISQTELGIRAGLQPPDTQLRPGAFGTAENRARGAIFGDAAQLEVELVRAAQAFSKELDDAVMKARIMPVFPQLQDAPLSVESIESEASAVGERVTIAERTY